MGLLKGQSRAVRIIVFISFPLGLLMVAAVLVGVNSFKSYRSVSESMMPCIDNGDEVFVSRLAYHFLDIERGDVILIDMPAGAGPGVDDRGIVRVVGLPGDTVEVRGGLTKVNGRLFTVAGDGGMPSYTMPEEEVPPDTLFVLGDNRDLSMDSHVWGFLPRDNVVGSVLIVYPESGSEMVLAERDSCRAYYAGG
ncbi:MAG: signal peptidase I [Gaiellales bacterium]|nr:MAG: signal peptidase I [Gaiellales bacterium]